MATARRGLNQETGASDKEVGRQAPASRPRLMLARISAARMSQSSICGVALASSAVISRYSATVSAQAGQLRTWRATVRLEKKVRSRVA